MLQPKQMSKLLIAATKDQMGPVISELYRHNLFHIEDYVESAAEEYKGVKIGTPLEGASEASGDLVKIRAIQNAFSIQNGDIEVTQRRKQADLQVMIERDLPAIEREIEGLAVKRLKLETHLKEYEQKMSEISPFVGIPGQLDQYRGYSTMVVFAGYVEKEVSLSVPHELFIKKGKGKSFMVAIAPAADRNAVESALQAAGYQAVAIPEESGDPQERISFYTAKITGIKAELADTSQKLDAIKAKHTGFLVACEEVLKGQVDQTEAPLRFATTGETFIAEGWVPSANVDGLSRALVTATGGKVFVIEVPGDPAHDVVPVEYNNPSFAQPTQMLMDIYSRPKYTELDPTLMLSVVFPLFFGLILGDVGYGLLLLAMCLGLRRVLKGEESAQLLTVLRNASFSSIIFGLLYSEFLGFALPWSPIMFSRHLNIGAHAEGHGPQIPALMILAIWIGLLHITLGRVLGMINHARQDHGDHRTKAVMANFGWICVMWGILMVIWSIVQMPYMPDFTTLPAVISGINIAAVVGAVMLVAGVVFIARDSGLELVELPTIISHVLSYARIVAVGLSSVAIAMVVNYIAIGMLISPQLENITILGALFIIIGVAVFLIGHALNTALGILGGGLHSIRLHYVEFFTKFYKGGGRKYSPFGQNRIFTED
jgi:V/A-type H+/Na+-transporting ATPase subunit I